MSDFIINLFEIAAAVSSVVVIVKVTKADNAYVKETDRLIDTTVTN